MTIELDLIEKWYATYGPMVFRRCRQLLRDEDLAADAMQDVFVKVLRQANSLHTTAPSSFLYTVATNLCLNLLRTHRLQIKNAEDELLMRIATISNLDERIIAKQFLTLTFQKELESTKVLAVLHLLDGLTLEQVASEVSMSVSGVRKRLRKLKAHISDLENV